MGLIGFGIGCMGSEGLLTVCPAGRARCARDGHFVACLPFLRRLGCAGPPFGRD
jgi:hypothetical protein